MYAMESVVLHDAQTEEHVHEDTPTVCGVDKIRYQDTYRITQPKTMNLFSNIRVSVRTSDDITPWQVWNDDDECFIFVQRTRTERGRGR